jgi:hypothetical protein
MGRPTLMRIIVVIQAVYYLLTGIWPIVSLRSFEAVTGPKTDDWLVQTVGVLAAAIGGTLLVGGWRQEPRGETLVLSVLSALSFTSVDLIFALSGTISRIYLADAVLQGSIIAALFAAGHIARNR